jgi:hypothetical protein
VALSSGGNTIYVRSQDGAGNYSTIASVSVTYNPPTGSLQVNLGPAGALSAGAQWQVDGGAWQSSGTTVSGLLVGSHTVTFKTITGWTTPGSQTPTVIANQTTTTAGTYVVVATSSAHFSSMAISNGSCWIELSGPVGSNYVLQASTNLIDWTPITTNVISTGGKRTFTDPTTNYVQRFYRAMPLSSGPFVLQPGPVDGKDIWTTSVYSYAPCASTPGGGLNDYELRVGGYGDLYYILMQFDLAGLPSSASSAVLYLYCYQLSTGGTSLYLDRITNTWNWATFSTGCDSNRLWWADKPGAVQWNPNSIATPVQGQWYAVDITTLYNAWQNGTYPNYGLQFRPVSYNNNNFDQFYSSDYMDDPTLRPKLIITP